jgi:ribose transport system permease protein
MSDTDTNRQTVPIPSAAASTGGSPSRGGSQFLSRYALPMLGLLLIIVFSLTLRSTFPTSRTVSSILSDQATVAMLALAEMLVVAVGHYDLSVGYSLGLLEIFTTGLLFRDHLAWGPIVIVVLLAGALIGLVNGLLVTLAKIDSFIATLGLGYLLYGIDNWYSQGQQVIGTGFPAPFANLNAASLLGIPAPAIYVIVLALVLWVVMEFTPTGRYMYAIGSNERAAALSGIKVRRFTLAAFVAAGLIVAAAAVVLAAKLQVGESDVGPEFLLPAFVGAMLGATAIKPGRVNVWGTVIAVLVLGIGIAGLEQLGGAFFVDPMFNGGTLIVAVGAAGFAARRRLARRRNDAGSARTAVTPLATTTTITEEGGTQ